MQSSDGIESLMLEEGDVVIIVREAGQIEVMTAAKSMDEVAERDITWAEDVAFKMVKSYLEENEKDMTSLPSGVLN